MPSRSIFFASALLAATTLAPALFAADVTKAPTVSAPSIPKETVVAPIRFLAPKPAHAALAQKVLSSTTAPGLVTNAKAIGAAPIRVTPAPPQQPPEPTPTPTRSWVQITGMSDTGPNGTAVCHASCFIQAGDVLVIKSAGGLAAAANEVHFAFYTSGQDVAVTPMGWSDTLVVVQVPKLLGTPTQSGAIYLGAPAGPVSSSFFGFNYAPTMQNEFVRFDPALYAAPQKVFRTVSYEAYAPSYTMLSRSMFDRTLISATHAPMAFGASSSDEIMYGFHLKNGWKVFAISFSQGSTGPSAHADVTESHVGTDDASVKVFWTASTGSSAVYLIAIEIQGEEGTSYL